MTLTDSHRQRLTEALEAKGQRATKQREHIFAVLLDQRDHPTADEVFARARPGMPSISLATVYNCLETLVGCGLVRLVSVERGPSRYCPNLAPHAHFYDEDTGRVFDVEVPENFLQELTGVLPNAYAVDQVELSFRGRRAQATSRLAARSGE